MTSPPRRTPILLFLIICLLAIVTGAGYIVWHRSSRVAVSSTVADELWPAGQALTTGAGQKHLLFRNTSLGEHQGRLMVARLDDTSGQRLVTPLTCERVHFAVGHGVCLVADRGFQTSYRAFVFDEN